jgi:hypothetical protein
MRRHAGTPHRHILALSDALSDDINKQFAGKFGA